jgi:hypothetical protein
MQPTIAGGLNDFVAPRRCKRTAAGRIQTEALRFRAISLSSQAMHPFAHAAQMMVRLIPLDGASRPHVVAGSNRWSERGVIIRRFAIAWGPFLL